MPLLEEDERTECKKELSCFYTTFVHFKFLHFFAEKKTENHCSINVNMFLL